MANGKCSVPDCSTVGPLVRGWCRPCYKWSSKRDWADPAGRPRQQQAPADGQCTVVEEGVKCTEQHRVKGMCDKHRQRLAQTGDPLTVGKAGNGVVLAALHAAAYAETDECVFLPHRTGRVTVQVDGVRSQAARVVWTIRHGDPGEAHVLHKCNGGSGAHGCINIRHLRKGNNSENQFDRGDAGVCVGESHSGSVLTEAEVRKIRERVADGETQRSLADEYGVSPATVCLIVSRRNWRRLS